METDQPNNTVITEINKENIFAMKYDLVFWKLWLMCLCTHSVY